LPPGCLISRKADQFRIFIQTEPSLIFSWVRVFQIHAEFDLRDRRHNARQDQIYRFDRAALRQKAAMCAVRKSCPDAPVTPTVNSIRISL
jgi:hypothetical protein